jgi:hypothetical protein
MHRWRSQLANSLILLHLDFLHLDNSTWAGFQVEQWAPFAALSSMLNLGESINSGFAVDVWRSNPFQTMTGFSNTQVANLFDGIQVDVAVRDTDAILSRLSYNIVLLGRIAFGPVIS